MEKLLKYFPLVKVDESTHSAFGICTAEVPDKDNEICDYADTKPQYEKWSSEALTSTTAAGQDPSLGNIRLQHDSGIIAGKAINLQFDDAKKQIWLEATPVDDSTWKMLKGGFIRGYSHAGRYIYRRCNVCKTDMPQPGNFCPTCSRNVAVRYAASISEVSFVDNPCLGIAHFSYVKSDRSIELKKFANEVAETTAEAADAPQGETGAEAAKAQAQAAAPVSGAVVNGKGKEHEIDVSEQEMPKAAAAPASHAGLRKSLPHFEQLAARVHEAFASKSMYTVSNLASILQDLKYLQYAQIYEASYEDDPRDAELAESIGDVLADLVQVLLDMVEEDGSELTASPAESTKGAKATMENPETELVKAGKGMAGHMKKSAAKFKKMANHHEKSAAAHEALAEAHDAIAAGSEGATAKAHKAAATAHRNAATAEMGKSEMCKDLAGHHEDMAEQATADRESAKTETVDAVTGMVKTQLAEAVAPLTAATGSLLEVVKSLKPAEAAAPAAGTPAAEGTPAAKAEGAGANPEGQQQAQKSDLPSTRKELTDLIAQAIVKHESTKMQPTGVTLVPPAGREQVAKSAPAQSDSIADAGL